MKMSNFFRRSTKPGKVKNLHNHNALDYVFEILLPDFMIFVVGVSLGFLIFLNLFQFL